MTHQESSNDVTSLSIQKCVCIEVTCREHARLQLRRSYPSSESAMMSQRERSLKGVFCAIDTACGMESVIQKLANSAPGSVNLLHDSWGNTGWVTKRLMVAAP